ncbi:MAG: hypothetical protein CEE40_08765 [Chloroflexi bacterium B3_Chlor]|nr:MAG: hypothetical protein CEE40_08765 [Chloroflexi bacterium B3_Chlor]
MRCKAGGAGRKVREKDYSNEFPTRSFDAMQRGRVQGLHWVRPRAAETFYQPLDRQAPSYDERRTGAQELVR